MVFGLQVRCRGLDIFKSEEFLGFFLEIFWNSFMRIFWEDFFFGGNFIGGIFGEKFFGRIFWEEFFGRNSLFTLLKLFEMKGIDLFVKICLEAEGRKEGGKFKSLEVRSQVHRT